MSPVLLRDLGRLGPHELSVADDFLASYVQPVDAVRSGQDKRGHRVARAGELEAVRPPDGEVGAFAGLDRAQIRTVEYLGAAARAESESLAGGERRRPTAASRHEERLLELG